MTTINVLKLDHLGNPTNHPYAYYPCIRLRYSFQASFAEPNGRRGLNGIVTALAMIDTGADLNLIKSDLIPSSASPVETVTNYGVNGATQERNYEVTFHLPEFDAFHQTGIISWSPGNNPPYDVILGRKFLQMCRFEFDQHEGIQNLTYSNNPHAI